MPPEAEVDTQPVTDEFDALTDRELLLSIARDIRSVRGLAAEGVARVQPIVDSLAKNPMFRLLIK